MTLDKPQSVSLYSRLKEDIRYREGLKACINCGTCTAICPAAGVSEYDPRQIVEMVQRHDEEVLATLLRGDEIWRCGECLSCKTRCPRGNTPGYIIQALRALSIESGMFAASEEGRRQIIVRKTVGEHMLRYGYCIYIDEVTTDYYPEQGPVWDWYRNNRRKILRDLGASYEESGAGTLRKIPEQSLRELRAIFEATGALERFRKIEDGVHENG